MSFAESTPEYEAWNAVWEHKYSRNWATKLQLTSGGHCSPYKVGERKLYPARPKSVVQEVLDQAHLEFARQKTNPLELVKP